MVRTIVTKLVLLGMLILAYTRTGECGPPLLFLGDSSVPHTVQQGQPLTIPVFISSGKETGSQAGEVLLGFFVSSEQGENATGVAYCLDLNNPKGWTQIGDSFLSLSDCIPISGVEFPRYLLVNWRALGAVDFPANSTMTWLACTDPIADGHVDVAFVEGDDTFCTTYTAKIIPSCSSLELLLNGSNSARVRFDDVDLSTTISSKVMAYEINGPSELTENGIDISIADKPEWLTVSLNKEEKFIAFVPNRGFFENTSQRNFQGTVKIKLKSTTCSIEKEVPVTITILEQNTISNQTQNQQSSSNDNSSGNTFFNKSVSLDIGSIFGFASSSSSKVLVYQSKTATMPDDSISVNIEQGQTYKTTLYIKNNKGQLISTLQYSDDASWMSVRKVGTGQLELTIYGSRLSEGQSYRGSITITDTSTNAKETVRVAVSVAGVCDPETAQIRSITDKSFSFTEGESSSSKTVYIEDTCGEKLAIEDLEMSKNVNWLTVQQNSTSLYLTANPSGLSAGYSDTVTITVYTAKGNENFNVSISVQTRTTTSSTTSRSTGIIKTVTPSFKLMSTGVYNYYDPKVTLKPGQGILYSFRASVPDSSKGISVVMQPSSVGVGGSGYANAYIKIGSEPTIAEVKSNDPSLVSHPRVGTIVEEVTYRKVMGESQVYVLIYNVGTKSDTFTLQIRHY